MNDRSDCWRYERIPGNVQNFFDYSDKAQSYKSDHWRQFRTDIDLMANELGLNTYRFSIDWSRVEPEEGRFDEQAIEHYAEMCRLMKERGISPMVTLFHWSSPDWIWDHNDEHNTGWYSQEIVDRFTRFCEKVVPALAPHVDLFITLNEPNIHMFGGYSEGILCPGHQNDDEVLPVIYRHLMMSHVAAWRVIKSVKASAQVGIANHMAPFEPVSRWNPVEA